MLDGYHFTYNVMVIGLNTTTLEDESYLRDIKDEFI